ncbi:hypothetical protein [Aquabacterium sp.]|uniref:hypothetical protein n=1 Tax=Aquabacterium sp. TaxID=1872578 RepID=UPI0035B2C034
MTGFLVRDDFTGAAATIPVDGERSPETQVGVSFAAMFAFGYGGDMESEGLRVDGSGHLIDSGGSASRAVIGMVISEVPETNILEISLRIKLTTPSSPFSGVPLTVYKDGDPTFVDLWAFDGERWFHSVSGAEGDVTTSLAFASDADGYTDIVITFAPGTMTVTSGVGAATCPSGLTSPWSGDLMVRFDTHLSGWSTIDSLQVRSLDADGPSAFWTAFVGSYEVP